jgi:cell division protein FtsN|tara:strand:- start:674 stop:1069 length:396 start_codon:yes stop_codon:yes gene_type:complete
MKERIVGSITILILISLALLFLLQGRGLESIESYNKQKNSIVLETSQTINDSIFGWVIQIEAFENYQQAQELTKELEDKRFNAFISKKDIAGKEIYRVRIRPRNINETIEKTERSLQRSNYAYQILPPGQQ